jgi:hypothetical protein
VTTLVRYCNPAVPDNMNDEWRGSGSMTDDGAESRRVQTASGVRTSGLHPTVQAAKEWFDSPRGAARASRILSLNRFPISSTELRLEALAQVWKIVNRQPEKIINNIEAYCQRVMQNVCFRASKARIETTASVEEHDRGSEDVINLDGVRKSAPELASKCRSAIETLEGEVGVKSAVLNFLTLSLYPETDCSDLPSPQRGATPLQARWWHAIALALQTLDLFPGAVAPSAAQRQSRRRFVMECQEFLDRAYMEVVRKEFEHE